MWDTLYLSREDGPVLQEGAGAGECHHCVQLSIYLYLPIYIYIYLSIYLGEMVRFCKEELELESVTIVSNGSLVRENLMYMYRLTLLNRTYTVRANRKQVYSVIF